MSIKYFRDPIHGYIEVPPHILKIIDSPYFQRLRRIKQLSFTHLVYHGAEHTRFGHSLGVYHLARKLSNSILKDEQEEIKEEFCLAALLHDIGHHPFSHSFESVLKKNLEDSGIDFDHANYTKELIKNTVIGDYIHGCGLSKDHIVQMIEGSFTEIPHLSYLNSLISSELDLDRLDYLLRDSYYCGIPYGNIDLERLLISLKPVEGEIIVSERGKPSTEMYVLARFYMYTQVYLHHTTRAFDLMLQRVLSRDVLEELDYPKPEKDDIERLVDFDDLWLYGRIKEISNSPDSKCQIAKKIINRDPIRCVIEKIAFVDAHSQATDPEFSTVKSISNNIDVIAKEADIKEEEIFVDEPWKDLPLENRYRPYTLSETQDEIKPIKVESRGKIMDIAEDTSSIAYYVAKYMAQIIRIYTPLECKDRLATAIRNRYKELHHLIWTKDS
jgi:hypothetical protein